MATRWRRNFTPDSSASLLINAWIEGASDGQLSTERLDVRAFLQRMRRAADLEEVDLVELGEYARFCARHALNDTRQRLFLALNGAVENLILDFGPSL